MLDYPPTQATVHGHDHAALCTGSLSTAKRLTYNILLIAAAVVVVAAAAQSPRSFLSSSLGT